MDVSTLFILSFLLGTWGTLLMALRATGVAACMLSGGCQGPSLLASPAR